MRDACELCDGLEDVRRRRVAGEPMAVCARCRTDLATSSRQVAATQRTGSTKRPPWTPAQGTHRGAHFLVRMVWSLWALPATTAVLHWGLDIGLPFSIVVGLLLQSLLLDVWPQSTGR